MTSSIISNLLETVCKIYFQLKEKSYMRSEEQEGFVYLNCGQQLQQGLTEVC